MAGKLQNSVATVMYLNHPSYYSQAFQMDETLWREYFVPTFITCVHTGSMNVNYEMWGKEEQRTLHIAYIRWMCDLYNRINMGFFDQVAATRIMLSNAYISDSSR